MAVFTSKQTFFELIDLAGEGLNGCVYKALRRDAHGTISQVVALKILKSKNPVQSWRQEVTSLLQVDSSHCVKVFGFEWVNDQPAMVLEWLEGVTLAQLFQFTELDSEMSLEILLQIQEGLIDLHLAGLCHGDLHMENIFITQDGIVKLLDFGIDNIQRYRSQGNPLYRAPELVKNLQPPSFWSDLFALGKIAEQMRVPMPELLNENPAQRDLIAGIRSPLQRHQLAEKVGLIKAKRDTILNQKTLQFDQPTSHKPSFFAVLLLTMWSSFFLSAASPLASTKNTECSVLVRTQKWYEVRIGNESKFSPTRFQLATCGKISISFQNASAKGRKSVYLAPGQEIRLSDRDFE